MNARNKLMAAGAFNKEMAQLSGQRVSKRLLARQKDYDAMIEEARNKDMSGFHKPGSNKHR